jgi:hypothetical protein
MAKKETQLRAKNVTTTSVENMHIDGDTHIIFTVKSFFTLIGTLLGLFFAFYLLVVTPRINKTEENYLEMYNEQKVLNQTFTKEITDIKLEMKSRN